MTDTTERRPGRPYFEPRGADALRRAIEQEQRQRPTAMDMAINGSRGYPTRGWTEAHGLSPLEAVQAIAGELTDAIGGAGRLFGPAVPAAILGYDVVDAYRRDERGRVQRIVEAAEQLHFDLRRRNEELDDENAEVLRLEAELARAQEAHDALVALSQRRDGVGLIAAERHRHQLPPDLGGEGWTLEHDLEHDDGDLARAAAAYALPPDDRHNLRYAVWGSTRMATRAGKPRWWPWRATWWKPTPGDRRSELVRAGALIAAELDRLAAAADNVEPF